MSDIDVVRRERRTEARVRAMDAVDIVAEIHALEDACERAKAERDAAREALRQAGLWFDEYADGHAAKGADDKAQRNRERAEFCKLAALGEAGHE